MEECKTRDDDEGRESKTARRTMKKSSSTASSLSASSTLSSSQWTVLYRASQELGPTLDTLKDNIASEYAHAWDATQEYSLEQTEAHLKYVKTAEEVLERILRQHNGTRREFFQECRESLDGKYCALFEEDVNLWFVNLLLAIDDFEVFAQTLGPRGKACRKPHASHK